MSNIKVSPGDGLAALLLQHVGTGGIISEGFDTAMRMLPPDTSRLDKKTADKIREFVKLNPMLLKALTDITKATHNLGGGKHVAHVPTHGVAELYASDRPRGNGELIENLQDVEKHCGIYTYDVVQQTPKLIKKDVDMVNVWKTTEEVATKKTLTGAWATEDPEAISKLKETAVCKVLPGAVVAADFVDEDIEIELTLEDTPLLSTQSEILGSIENGVQNTSKESKTKISRNVNQFRRTGEFADKHHITLPFDDVSPKVDGEPLLIRTGGGKSYAVSRSGLRYGVKVKGRFEAEGREARRIKANVELYPGIHDPKQAFLTHFWYFGIGNDIGRRLLSRLLERKRITISLPGGKKLPLELPTFENVPQFDGIVMHCGTEQYFVKKHPTIDVKEPGTKKYLDDMLGARQEWRDGLWEYEVRHCDGENVGLSLYPFRQRFDKTRENGLENIIAAINAPNYDAWLEKLAESGLLGTQEE
jgi:hypothetical protein